MVDGKIPKMSKSYGVELILDLYGCDIYRFSRTHIEDWLDRLCRLIKMKQADLHFWDYEGYPEEKERAPAHIAGTSAVQFITTSDIVIHTLDKLGECYINIFTCKKLDVDKAIKFTVDWFGARDYDFTVIKRGMKSKR